MLQKQTVKDFLEQLSSRKPTPGGGSAAALAGAAAAGLLSMAAKLSQDQKTSQKADRLMKVLVSLIDKDAAAFEGVMKKKPSLEKALKYAAEIPLQTARYAYEVLKLAESLLKNCNPNVITDIGVAAKMAEAAVEGALLNVKVNLGSIKDKEFKKEIDKAVKGLYLTGYRTRMLISQIQGKI